MIAGKSAIYIAKPLHGSQGSSIVLFRDLRELSSKKYEEMVVQRYINNPYLLDGLKFDIRLYVIITGTNEGLMHAFLADEGLVRFCTTEYEKACQSNFHKVYMHLANYSINKNSKDYVDDLTVDDILKPNKATKRTMESLYTQI